MDVRHGVRGTECDGVFFTEEAIDGATSIRHLAVEISRQNANLSEVKRRLAHQAKQVEANTIMNFKYGQEAHPRWKLVLTLKWDTESWHGEGDAVRL